MELNTPKRIKTLTSFATSPPSNEIPYNWPGDDFLNNCHSPEEINSFGSANGYENRENKRGRPRSEVITTLMLEGNVSPSAIKCKFCSRVFPREKSLAAHLRTHTGERPYNCDYPGCTRAFTQSGQLKTHLRLHTGERPFVCSAQSCQMRFVHANRHCPDHPYDQLKRSDDFIIQTIPEQNVEVIKWLEKYRLEREDRTPTRKTPKRSKQVKDNNENFSGGENENDFPMTPSNSYKSRKGLMVELDMNAGLGSSPIAVKNKPNPKIIQWLEPLSQEEDSGDESEIPAVSTFNPKKRWLREAWQDDLAKPLEPISNNLTLVQKSTEIVNPNQMRPTVLMVAGKDRAMPLLDLHQKTEINSNSITLDKRSPLHVDENRKWLGALALMELATDADDGVESSVSPGNITHTSVIQSYTQL